MRLHFKGNRRIVFFVLVAGITVACVCIALFCVDCALWMKADRCFENGDHLSAAGYLGAVTCINRHDVRAYQLKAWLEWSFALEQCRRGDEFSPMLARSLQTLERGEKANPRAWELFLEEGLLWECFGQRERSVGCYRTMALYAPVPYVRLYPGILVKCGRVREARDAMEAICARSNDQMSVRQLRELNEMVVTTNKE